MAVINYSDQFKYAGKGYMDAKVAPVANLDDLTSISSFVLAKYYTPGMVVMVLDDGRGKGPTQYVLTNDYVWEKISDDTNLGDMEERIDTIESSVVSLDTRMSEIASKSNENSEKIGTLTNKLEQIAGIEKLKAGENIVFSSDEEGNLVISAEVPEIEIPEIDLTEIENRIGAVEGDVDNLAGRIEATESGITAIEEAYKAADDALSNRLNTLAGRMTNVESGITANAEDVQTLNNRLNEIAGIVSGNNEEIKALDLAFNDFATTTDSKINVITGEVETIKTRLDSIPSGEGDIAVDDITIQKDENKKLSVKISAEDGNALTVNEDGLFSSGITLSGDDLENEIL